ncbi:MerR family transcriptional regulator [Bacteriovorax stolpii]|uniref:HTH merR-type domain-containing protein n=1 Tax=Bacteriovorax stolpii TaxID=960 RepID=A0A2K9NP27_BACTC|nr:MerR family transcriptional regulator [Bacteriovorax stolpii]AUN97248.1 hypothetical protein C0V70_03810 [Bacteriovorax stolpii]QDK42813.1 MerR family transcriptional regulator [Bacteriovorax stolpii]
MYPINVVEKETNISKYLLRMWERRYSFPRPGRDQKGERVYTNEDLEKLKLIKALMEEGYRPSKIIDQSLNELRELSKSFGLTEGSLKGEVVVLVTSPALEADVQEALKNHRVKRIFKVSSHEDIKNLAL